MIKRVAWGSALLLAAVLVFVIVECAVNPVTGKRELMLLSESDEVALGGQTDEQIIQSYGLYEDAELTAYIDAMGQHMSRITHRPNLNYHFKVLDTPVVNAFAVPGGYVYFTRGILSYLNNEAELAGVMGHELGHVNARHSAVQYSRAQLAMLGLGVGMVFSEKFRQYAGLAQFGVSMLFLRFSRDNERQADDLGVEYSMKTGYDADNMASFFETLERMNPGSDASGLPGWFTTHPNPTDRIGAVKRKTQEFRSKLPGPFAVNREPYLTQLDGLVHGEDPRQGYVEGNAFYHPGLQFTFPLPADWGVNNTPAQVQIVSKAEDAAIMFALDSGATPAAAAQQFTQQSGGRVLASDALQINGLSAHRLLSEVTSEEQALEVMSTFIKMDDRIFVFHGFTAPAQFGTYRPAFDNTMGKFKRLTDASKLNVKPSRLQLKKTRTHGSVRAGLSGLGVAADQLESIALLNGMLLEQTIEAGTTLKLVAK